MGTFSRLVLGLALAAAANAQQLYRDPAGQFALPVPPGWTATPNGPVLMLVSRESYGLVTVVQGGGADPRRVAQYTDQFGRQWQGYQRLRTGDASLGNTKGMFALYTGKNPKGADAVVKATSVPRGNDAVVLLFASPAQDWNRIKNDMEAMERGFTLTGGAAPQQQTPPRTPQAQGPPRVASPPPPPQRDPSGAITLPPGGVFGDPVPPRPVQPQIPRPAPVPATPAPPPPAMAAPGTRSLPPGFSVSARSGQMGQALTASLQGGSSARMVFRGIFRQLGSYFDSPLQMNGAAGNASDTQLLAFFRTQFQGARVRGLVSVAVGGGSGCVSILFDRDELFGRSLSTLSRGMAAVLPVSRAGEGAAGGGTMARPAPLQQTQLLDGSGFVGIPAGWRITGSYKGVVDIVGPNGQNASFGGYQVAYVMNTPGTPATVMTGPYRPPAAALQLYYDCLTQRALSRGIASFRVIEQLPVQSDKGQSAYITFQMSSAGKTATGFALVTTAPIDNTQWFYYMSAVSAPAERFPADFPTMWAMWKSWSVNPSVFKERMDAALQSMRETTKIILSVNENRRRVYDNANAAWDQVIRGVTTIQDAVTGERADIDNGNLDFILGRLNEGGGERYSPVPMGELVR